MHGGRVLVTYVGIKYTTLAYWLKRRRRLGKREKLKAEAGKEPGRSNGTWIEAVVEKNGSPAGGLRIYFAPAPVVR
jgi:hypothetical protein